MTHATRQADLAGVIVARAGERPGAVAVEHVGRSTTWAALVTRVRRLAAALRAAGDAVQVPASRTGRAGPANGSCLILKLD